MELIFSGCPADMSCFRGHDQIIILNNTLWLLPTQLEKILSFSGSGDNPDPDAAAHQTLAPFRAAFEGPILAAGGYMKATAAEEIESGTADLIAFGKSLENF